MARGGYVKNLDEVNRGIDFWIKRVEQKPVEFYRKIAWDVFLRLTLKTPQWSGRAVANWRIGIGAPDYSFDPDLGDQDAGIENLSTYTAREQGDTKWIEVARRREKKKLLLLRNVRQKVFFTNMAEGDGRWGVDDDAGLYYLEAMQKPDFWMANLRMANKPYETVQETLIYVTELEGRLRGDVFGIGGYSTRGLL